MGARGLLFAVIVGTSAYMGCAAPTSDSDEPDEALSATSDPLTDNEVAEAKARTAEFEDVDPDLTPEEEEAIVAPFATIPHPGVREDLFKKAITYYEKNKSRIRNKRWLSIVDFQKHSGKKRFFVLDMNGGPMKSYVTAHGKKSDENDDGIATSFGNVVGSNKSSLGFYATAETYTGSHGLSLKLDGLSSTNSNVRERVIVIHSAAYVEEGRTKQGRSEGCFVFDVDVKPWIVSNLKGGSIIYASN